MRLPTVLTLISLWAITTLSTAIPSMTSLPECGYVAVEGNYHKGETIDINSDGVCRSLLKPSIAYELNKGCSCTFYGGNGNCTGGHIVDATGPSGSGLMGAWAYDCVMAPT